MGEPKIKGFFPTVFKENSFDGKRRSYGNRGKSEGRQGSASHCKRQREGVAFPADRISWHFERRWLRKVFGREHHML